MKKIFIILLAVIFNTAFAQQENADAVFEKITKTYTLSDDGSISYRYFKQLKLLTHLAFNRLYGETFIVYNPDFQDLKINNSYTIMANGEKIDAPDNAFNEVLPRGAAHSAAFNHLREMVITHTALEPGATIVLDYTLTSKKGFWPALMGNEIIQESSPVDALDIIVEVPADVELQHKMFNLRTAPEIMVIGSKKVYTWQFSGLSASPNESFKGNLPNVPRLVFSSEKNQGVLFDRMMNQKAFDYSASDEMIQFVDDLKNPANEIKTMLAIQQEAAKNMKYDHVPLEWMGFRVRTPEEVWESNGGNELEKAIVLTALLKAADFNAVPVLIGPRKFYDKNIANLLLFEHVAVMLNTKSEGTIYISPTGMNDQTMEYEFANLVIAPLYKNADFSVLEPSAAKNALAIKGDFKISSETDLSRLIEVELFGAVNPFLDLQEEVQHLASDITGGIISKSEKAVQILNSNTSKTQATLEVEKFSACKEQLGFYRFQLPEMKTGFQSWHIHYLNSERKDIFVLPYELEEKYEFEIEIPEGFEFINTKHAVNLKNNAGSIKIEISPRKNTITVKRELVLNTLEIHPESYPGFRELINEWLDENLKMIVFRKDVD